MKLALLFISVLTATPSIAREFICHTPNEEKSFKVFKDKVSFLSEVPARKIASSKRARTHFTDTGFTKVVSHEGLKYKIHIANTEKPNALEDFVVIISQKGHRITYPLACL